VIKSLPQVSAATKALSAYIASAGRRPLPDEVVEKAKHHLLDTLAAMISGSRLLPGRMAQRYIASQGGPREASVMASRLRVSVVNAALANGMLAHADETDDSHAPSRNHPGCAVIPAALAMAESRHAGGEALLRALVLGYDVAARINYALDADGFALAFRSTHSTGGTFGAGAAAGSLLPLDEQEARYLLSFCAQQASGVGCNVRDTDHIEKAFDFGGMPARNGATAATMIAAGFTGVDDVFSGERNFFDAFAINPKPEHLADGLGARYEIMGTNIKKWSVGSPAQSALDALTMIMKTHDVTAERIAAITVQLPTRSARTVDDAPMPDINVQHLMSVMLCDGQLTFHMAHDYARMSDPDILAIKQKIRLVGSAELMEARPRRQAIVEVETTDGRKLSHRTIAVRGTADNPMDRREVEDKARDLIAEVLGKRRANDIIRVIGKIETVSDMADLQKLWRPSGLAATSAGDISEPTGDMSAPTSDTHP
jgi:2-methylcitrate dehydratase PrpD